MPNKTQLAWLNQIVPIARTTSRLWRVPVSITLAQAILESAWGTSQLAVLANNFFGIKAIPGQEFMEFPTHEVVRGRTATELADFARYSTIIDCFAAHAHLLATLPRYAPAMAAYPSPVAFAIALQRCGYSTEPTYAARLTALIRDLGLEKHDLVPEGVPDFTGSGKGAA